MDTFSASANLTWAWETFKKRPWFFIGVTVIIIIASWLISFIGGLAGGSFGDNPAGAAVSFLVSMVLQTFLGLGTISLFLKAHESPDSAEIQHLWHPQPFWKYLAASLLTGLAIMVGLVLLIVPGIIAMLMFVFTTYVVVDRELDPIAAMKESIRITKGSRLNLLILLVLLALLNIAGALLLFVGLLVTIPLTSLALVHAYRTLEHSASEVVAT